MRSSWSGKRQAERRTCSVKAQAQLYDGGAAIDCIVTDFSATGARLEFPAGREPPNAFDLFVPSRGDTRPATVRWKTAEAIGIEFLQVRATTEDQRLSELLVRVHRLEDELRAMRAEATLARGSNFAPTQEAMPATPMPAAPEAATVLVAPIDDELYARVNTLESRGDEMLQAMRQTLVLLGDLRDATAPRAAVASAPPVYLAKAS